MGDPSKSARLERVLSVAVPGWREHLDGALWRLFFARTINTLAFSFAFPFLAAWLAHERSLSATATGAVFMAQGLVGALSQVPGGVLADRLGRRATLVLSLCARSVLVLGLGLAVRAHASVPVVVALVLGNAIATGFFQPAADALVVELSPAAQRVAAFAHQRVAINIGWVAGPALGGLAAAQGDFSVLFLTAAPLILLSAVLTAGVPEPAPETVAAAAASEGPSRRGLLSDRALVLQLAGALLTFTLAAQMVVTLSVDTSARLGTTQQELGWLWSLNGVLVVLAQMPVARLVTRMGSRTALVAGSALYGLSYAAVGFAGSYAHLVACMVGVTAGELLNAPAQQTAVAARAPAGALARVLGMLGFVMVLGRSLGPLAGGALRDALGGAPHATWGLLGALGLLAALLYAVPAPGSGAPARPAPERRTPVPPAAHRPEI